jgi:hypothetical protein
MGARGAAMRYFMPEHEVFVRQYDPDEWFEFAKWLDLPCYRTWSEDQHLCITPLYLKVKPGEFVVKDGERLSVHHDMAEVMSIYRTEVERT